MRPARPLILIYDALLRPARFAAFLEGGYRAIWLAALSTFGFLVITFTCIALGLSQILLIQPRALLAGALLAAPLAMLFAGLAVMIIGASRVITTSVAFSLMRCLIAIAPLGNLILSIGYDSVYLEWEGLPVALLFLPLFGAWFGGLIAVIAVLLRPAESAMLRWAVAAGGAIIGVLLWWSPVLRPYGVGMIVLLCAGLSAGVLRPISYLWEALLSLGLLLTAWLGVPARRLLPIHPAMYDDLCLLPLPGLRALLVRACSSDCADGAAWILRVGRHPCQEVAARRAVHEIVCEGSYAHPLLFQLSTQLEGATLLRRMVEETARPEPLIAAYAAFAHVESPEAWPAAVAQHHSTIAAAAPLPGGEAVLALLEAGAGTLRADRWSVATDRLRASTHPHGEDLAALGAALAAVRAWVDTVVPVCVANRARALSALQEDLDTLEGWPAALIAAVAEHLLFLLSIEKRRNVLQEDASATIPNAQYTEGTMAVDAQSTTPRLEVQPKTPGAAPQEILHIHISRLRSAENAYQFTLHQPGVARMGGPARMEKLVTTSELQAIRADYERRISIFHKWAARGLAIAPPREEKLVELGERIAELLPPLARQSIADAVRRAQRQRHSLLILLEVAANARTLLGIPWELLTLSLAGGPKIDEGGDFLLLNAGIALTRQVYEVGRNIAPDLPPSFTLQAVASAPEDGRPIDLASARGALAEVFTVDDLASCWYDGTDTLGILQDRLRSENPHILHLICHGEQSHTGLDTRRDLLFTHRDGYTQRVNASNLAPVLTLAPNLQVVVLQACHAGMVDAPTSAVLESERLTIESIALALVRQGVPAVVAMQGEVREDAANAFVRTFYTVLKEGQSLDQAVAAARIAMRTAGGIVDWSLPVVYQGSGQPEPSTWYTRFADRVDAALSDPATLRTMRGILVAWALGLLVVAVMQWLLLPSRPSVSRSLLVLPLVAWVAVGVVGPAIIATLHLSIRYHPGVSLAQERAARNAQWIGAYLGYAIGGILGLGVFATLWVLGIVALLPSPWPQICFGCVIVAAMVFSYVIARSQVQLALAIAVVDASLFDRRTTGLVIVAMLMLQAVPLLLLLIPGVSDVLLHPAGAALALALGIITLVVLSSSDRQVR